MKPRPAPPTPAPLDDQSDFNRQEDLSLRSGGPRDFARVTYGSKQVSGKSQVRKPEP